MRPSKPETRTLAMPAVASREHRDALVGGEQPVLGHVDADGDDDLVEELGGSPDDVEVAVGHRVERPGADSATHGRLPSRRGAPDPVWVRGPGWRDRTKAWSRRTPRAVLHDPVAASDDRLRLAARSTTTSAPGTSQPWSTSAARSAATSCVGHRVGRVGEHQVVGSGGRRLRGPSRRTRPPPGPARSRGRRRCGRSGTPYAGPARPSSPRRPPATTPRGPRHPSRRTGRGSAARRGSRCGPRSPRTAPRAPGRSSDGSSGLAASPDGAPRPFPR